MYFYLRASLLLCQSNISYVFSYIFLLANTFQHFTIFPLPFAYSFFPVQHLYFPSFQTSLGSLHAMSVTMTLEIVPPRNEGISYLTVWGQKKQGTTLDMCLICASQVLPALIIAGQYND